MNTLRVLSMLLCVFAIGGCAVLDARSKEPYCNLHARFFGDELVRNYPPDPLIHGCSNGNIALAMQSEFPHAQHSTSIDTSAWISYAHVSQCPACLEAEARWEFQHGGRFSTHEQQWLYQRAHADAINCLSSFAVAMCPVHHEPLREDAVPACFGNEGITPDGYIEAAKGFPYAFTKVQMGCMDDGKHTHALIRYCPKCRVAQADWLKKQGPDFRLPAQSTYVAQIGIAEDSQVTRASP